MMRYRNVFEAIARDGHDEHFHPRHTADFLPTDAAPGSPEKLAFLRRRVTLGFPLWHESDRRDYRDLTGAVPPRYA
jgi:hypothetical protein